MRYRATVHHRFEVDGTAFVYGASNAAVVTLDDLSDRVLRDFGGSGADLESWSCAQTEPLEARESFEELVAMGLIAPEGEIGPEADQLPPMPFPLSTLVLNVTNKCNLSCTYCYEYGEDRIADAGAKKAPRMSADIARKSIDLLFAEARGRGEVNVTFFGGETLLNFETIRDAVLHAERRARETRRRVSFALTTNATLLTDEIVAFLAEHRFGVNVSIDGAREDHDRHRRFRSGKGSYELILPRVQKLLGALRGGRPVGARVTLTQGMRDVRETFDHLTRVVGFESVGFAPVTSAQDRDWAIDESGMGAVLEAFRALADDYVRAALENRHHGFSNLNDLLAEVHKGVRKAHPCGAGLGLVGVSTEGEIGLCHRFVESGEHALGDVERGIDAGKRRSFLAAAHISKKVACHECFARPHCSGGCYHEAYVRYRDATRPNLHYCEWVRAWTALGLESYARIALSNPAFLERFAPRPLSAANSGGGSS